MHKKKISAGKVKKSRIMTYFGTQISYMVFMFGTGQVVIN